MPPLRRPALRAPPRPTGPPPRPQPSGPPLVAPLPHALPVVDVSPPADDLVIYLRELLGSLVESGGDDIPDNVRISIRLWTQRHPQDSFLGRFETLPTTALWKEALRYILDVDDTTDAGPTSPQDRFLQYIRRHRREAAGGLGEPADPILSLPALRDRIADRTVLPQNFRRTLTPAVLRDHLKDLSFRDLILLGELKDIPPDAPLSTLERAFRAIVKEEEDSPTAWANHLWSRLFDKNLSPDGTLVRTYIRQACFFPTRAREICAMIRSFRWMPIREAIEEHGPFPDRLPPSFWEEQTTEDYRKRFPARLWTLDRVSEWETLLDRIDRFPDTEDAGLLYIIETIRPTPRTVVLSSPAPAGSGAGRGRSATAVAAPTAPRPPHYIRPSGSHFSPESQVALLRSQPWVADHVVADLLIQALDTAEGRVVIESVFYTDRAHTVDGGDVAWMPSARFFESVFPAASTSQPPPVVPRMVYHNQTDTITLPDADPHGGHFRIHLLLANGQTVQMRREIFDRQQAWFRKATEWDVPAARKLSIEHLAERPLLQFETGWLDALRRKETAILTSLLTQSTPTILPGGYAWDWEKLASAIENACVDADSQRIDRLVSLRRYWERLFVVHAVFAQRSPIASLRRVLVDRIRSGMIRLDRIGLMPFAVLIPEMHALTADETGQLRSALDHRQRRFVEDRLVEHVGYFFPPTLTERRRTVSTFRLPPTETIQLPYPTPVLDTVVRRTGASSPRFLIWEENARSFVSLLHPAVWSPSVRATVAAFFDEDSFDIPHAETAFVLSDAMAFLIRGSTAPAARPPPLGGEAADRPRPVPPSGAARPAEVSPWTLPDFLTHMQSRIESIRS